ncbi:MAG: cupin domain-containing protein [Acidobacteriota bacterium]|jgi:quercetin dioxygenase-like cupin family protein
MEEIRDQVRPLAELVTYQEGSVVSRILLQQQKGTVTLFAFDRDQDLSEHTVPHDALVQVLDGEAEIAVADKPHRVRAGEVLVIPAGLPHRVRAHRRFKMLLTLIRG